MVNVKGLNDGDTAFAWTNRVQVTMPLTTGGYKTCTPVGPAAGGPRQVTIAAGSTEEIPYQCTVPVTGKVEVSVRLYGGDPMKFSGSAT